MIFRQLEAYTLTEIWSLFFFFFNNQTFYKITSHQIVWWSKEVRRKKVCRQNRLHTCATSGLSTTEPTLAKIICTVTNMYIFKLE